MAGSIGHERSPRNTLARLDHSRPQVAESINDQTTLTRGIENHIAFALSGYVSYFLDRQGPGDV
jgi:hypothetical protein